MVDAAAVETGAVLISIFLIENAPWPIMWLLSGNVSEMGKNFGEWAWVGRTYEREDEIAS